MKRPSPTRKRGAKPRRGLNRREFLKTTITGALVTSVAMSPIAVATPAFADDLAVDKEYGFYGRGKASWRNWSQNVLVTPEAVARPTNLEQLRQVVRSARRVRAVGSGHSITALAPSECTLIHTGYLDGIRDFETKKRRVSVRGGMKLRAFSNALADLGYALPSTGDTFYQSLAGLLSTGTHGTGMKWGSCSDETSLVGLTMVLADGSVLTLDDDVPDDRPLLEAARVGLGALGIIYSVTLKVDELHNLEHCAEKLTLDKALCPDHLDDNDHYEFAYFSHLPEPSCYAFFRNRTNASRSAITNWPALVRKAFNDRILENALPDIVFRALRNRPELVPRIHQFVMNGLKDAHEIDRCDRIMTIPRETPAYLSEFAIPIERTREAAEAFKDLTQKFKNKPAGERYYVNLPAQVRFVRGDCGTLISPGQGRATCWFGVGSSTYFHGEEPFFCEMEQALLDLGGRPHWGKMFRQNPRKLYPRFAEYEAIRQKLDPGNKFANPYIERLVGLRDDTGDPF